MSSKNVGKKKIMTIKGERKVGKSPKNKSPFKKDKLISNLNKKIINITFPNKENNYLEKSSNNFVHDITEERENNLGIKKKKTHFSKLNNSLDNFDFNDNNFIYPLTNRDSPLLTDSNLYNFKINNTNTITNKNIKNIKNKTMKNLTSPNIKNKNKNRVPTNNINRSIILNKNSSAIINNIPYKTEPLDSKYSIKINKIKDDYIDFLQKEFEDHTKKSVQLDSNNKELLKKCDDLISDNRILTNSLNDRTSKLNKIIQENLMVKAELDKNLLINQKNEQKIQFYEEQFNLFKTSNENYQKIINEIKEQNKQLNSNLIEVERACEEKLKNAENNYKYQLKDEIENNKKEMEEFHNKEIKEINEKNEKNTQSFLDKIKELEDKNKQLLNDLTNKNNMFDLVCKENEKLTNENKLLRTQQDQNSHKISELNTIIKHKDNIINNLKKEYLNSNDKFLNKSSSCSIMKFDGSEYINENISKLISDNEENKLKIELLNDKLKSIDEIEKKYNEIMSEARTLSLSEKLAYQINNINISPKNAPTHFNINSMNEIKNSTNQKNTVTKNTVNKRLNRNNYKSFVSPKKLQLGDDLNSFSTSPIIVKTTYEKTDYNTQTKEIKPKARNNVIVFSSTITKDNKRKNIKNNTSNNNNSENKPKIRASFDREIKVTKKEDKNPEKDTKNISKTKKIEIITTPIKERYYHKVEENKIKPFEKNKKVIHGKDSNLEKEEVKESVREMDRKKNYTYKPKIFSYSLDEINYGQKLDDQSLTISNIDKIEEDKKGEQNTLYLYGIDRNDILHIFDINDKKWCDMKKIANLYDKSETFRKDYQYEGTILYNTLYGVYILTGQKTDTLYYLNSQTNSITKICKFYNCHDNGSIMYDENKNCIYVFGGKKINSCEYYSFKDKKVYRLPNLITDRANASFIISNNKIYGFFGFSYSKNGYAKSIEYMDFTKKDRWFELKNIKLLKQDISFDIESVSTMYYRQNQSQILIYCGIQGEEEDFVTEYYLLYDTKNNTMDKINKWSTQQFKSFGKIWKNYNLKKNDPKGFHFAKNTRFIFLPRGNSYEGYNERDLIHILIDYKNNIHYILQEKQKIDIYRSDM